MRIMILMLMAVLFTACGGGNSCKSKESCINDQKCQCWCSVKCGYRDKTAADHPVYVENDPNGKHCYCKQWDLDMYQANCVEKQNVPQPANAQ